MYQSRQPITDDNYAAFRAAQAAKPLISGTPDRPREMSVQIMGDWLRARPGITDKDIAKEFTATERNRFLEDAIDYAIRHSGGMN